jgi:hypothetical protein
MTFLENHPLSLLLFSLVVLWVAAQLGKLLRRYRGESKLIDPEDFDLVIGATLTLLGLIIGFTFSMALNRYDQRKNYEEAEANAIGTEYVRADLLPPAAASKVRSLLREYTDQRVLYYTTRNPERLRQVRADTEQLEANMWSAVTPLAAQRDSISALVLSGMNDTINSEGYTQAAWMNRVPVAAWFLLLSIAFFCNVLVGYRAESGKASVLLLVLPLAIAISFFLIADIDSPRSGVIRVAPLNLESLADSLRPH